MRERPRPDLIPSSMRARCSQHRGQGLGGGYLASKLITKIWWLGLGQGGAESPASVLGRSQNFTTCTSGGGTPGLGSFLIIS